MDIYFTVGFIAIILMLPITYVHYFLIDTIRKKFGYAFSTLFLLLYVIIIALLVYLLTNGYLNLYISIFIYIFILCMSVIYFKKEFIIDVKEFIKIFRKDK